MAAKETAKGENSSQPSHPVRTLRRLARIYPTVIVPFFSMMNWSIGQERKLSAVSPSLMREQSVSYATGVRVSSLSR